MTVTTVFATEPGGNGFVRSSDATYATARSGGTLLASGNHSIGQEFNTGAAVYRCLESFVIFDTSGIADTDTVSAVVLSLDGSSDGSTQDFTVVASASSYDGGAVATTDYVAGASLAGLTEYATWSTAGYSADYNAFTQSAGFPAGINKTGNTPIILFSDRHRDATAPNVDGTLETVAFIDADAAGTTTDPKLDITHAAGGGATVKPLAALGVG